MFSIKLEINLKAKKHEINCFMNKKPKILNNITGLKAYWITLSDSLICFIWLIQLHTAADPNDLLFIVHKFPESKTWKFEIVFVFKILVLTLKTSLYRFPETPKEQELWLMSFQEIREIFLPFIIFYSHTTVPHYLSKYSRHDDSANRQIRQWMRLVFFGLKVLSANIKAIAQVKPVEDEPQLKQSKHYLPKTARMKNVRCI